MAIVGGLLAFVAFGGGAYALDLCAPGQRWTYAQPKFADSDLSCEPE
jgi:hypothetical protein